MRIVILGGGTAGWLAALMILKVQGASHDVTVIESSRIGIVGAGEGSTGFLTDIIQNMSWDYGCDEGDFLRETGATIKLGIRHRDWRRVGEDYIGPIDGAIAGGAGTDYLLCHAVAHGLPFHEASFNGGLISRSVAPFYRDQESGSDSLLNMHSHAYHFDAHLVGRYFRGVCGDEITHLDAEVTEVEVDERGDITALGLADGRRVEGDLFIDCSGFARVLGRRLGIGWKSYRDHLPVNTAMPFLLPHAEGERIDPVTIAWAQRAGWMWMIPTQERWGCGYVFDDAFATPDEAQAEIEGVLGHEIEPIRVFGFETGRSEVLWHRNCLMLGLAAAFAEPLEATSIHSTIIQLNTFVFQFLRDTVEDTLNPASVAIYNRSMARMYDDFMDFLNIHYAGGRTDSEFWRWIATGETLTPHSRQVIDLLRARIVRPSDLITYPGHAGPSLYNWVLAGLGFIDESLARRELEFSGQADLARTVWAINDESMTQMAATMIDHTEFVAHAREYAYGHRLPK